MPSDEQVERVRVAHQAKRAVRGPEPETKYGFKHGDDDSECTEPAWCQREHVRTPVARAAPSGGEDRG